MTHLVPQSMCHAPVRQAPATPPRRSSPSASLSSRCRRVSVVPLPPRDCSLRTLLARRGHRRRMPVERSSTTVPIGKECCPSPSRTSITVWCSGTWGSSPTSVVSRISPFSMRVCVTSPTASSGHPSAWRRASWSGISTISTSPVAITRPASRSRAATTACRVAVASATHCSVQNNATPTDSASSMWRSCHSSLRVCNDTPCLLSSVSDEGRNLRANRIRKAIMVP